MKISARISNLSYGFRGVTKIRESIHSVFLHHVILEAAAGMDVGIVNALELLSIDELGPESREASENVVLNKMENATEVMLDLTCESDFAAAQKLTERKKVT